VTGSEPTRTITARQLVWVATLAVAVAVVGLLRVPTHLGVKVVEANSAAPFTTPAMDFHGRDYLWRVWWRARDDMIDVSPSWLLVVALLVGLAVFVVGVFAAYRLALSIPSSPPPRDV